MVADVGAVYNLEPLCYEYFAVARLMEWYMMIYDGCCETRVKAIVVLLLSAGNVEGMWWVGVRVYVSVYGIRRGKGEGLFICLWNQSHGLRSSETSQADR